MAAEKVVEMNTTKWEFDLTGLKVQEFREIMGISLIDNAAYKRGVPHLMKRIKAWPFAGDPGKLESYDQLDYFSEWQQLIAQLTAAIREQAKK